MLDEEPGAIIERARVTAQSASPFPARGEVGAASLR